MSEMIKLDSSLSALDNLKKLIAQAAPTLDLNRFDLGIPTDAKEDSSTPHNTHLPATLRSDSVSLNYLVRYDRVEPVESYGKHTIMVSRKTTANELREKLKELGLISDQVDFFFNHEEEPNYTHPHSIHLSTESMFESLAFNDIRHYKSLTFKAKDESYVYRGATTVKLLDTSGVIDIIGWTPNSMPDVTATALQNFNGLLIGQLLNDPSRVVSVTDVEAMPVGNPTGKNTKATITYTLENGLEVKDTVVYNRAPLMLKGGVTSIVIEEEVFKAGFEGVYDFVNRFISDKLVENTDKSVLENETDGMEFEIANVNSKEDLVRAITEKQEITLYARSDSLIYQGGVRITVTVNPIELDLAGFQSEEAKEPADEKETKQPETKDNHAIEIDD